MPHIIILDELIEMLQAFSNPSQALQNLLAACQAAEDYAHGSDPDPDVLQGIESLSTFIKWYFDFRSPVSESQAQSFADQMNSIVP